MAFIKKKFTRLIQLWNEFWRSFSVVLISLKMAPFFISSVLQHPNAADIVQKNVCKDWVKTRQDNLIH